MSSTTEIEIGSVSIIPAGEYSSDTQYERLSVVTYEGSAYIAIQTNKGQAVTDTNYWFKLVEKGAAGDGFNNANYNEKTGILTFTNPDGSTVEVQLPLNTSELKKLQGTSFHITNSAEAPMKISPRGNDIEQETREGYNSNSMPDNSGGTVSGVQYSISKSVLKLNGTCTGGSQIPTSRFKIGTFPAGTYSLMFFKNKGSMTPMGTGLYINDALTGGNRIASKYLYDYENITEITLEAETTLYGYIWQDTNSVYTDLELGIMVASGTYTSKPNWEQYGAMPSLAFPSPVKHVGGKFKSYNEFDGVFRQGNAIDSTVTTRLFSTQIKQIKAGETYTITTSLDFSKYIYSPALFTKMPATGWGDIAQDVGWITDKSYKFIAKTDGYFVIGIAKSNTTEDLTLEDIKDYWFMVYKGTEEKPYLPYGEVGSVYNIAKVNKNVLGWGIQLIDNIGWNASGVKYTTDNTFGTNDLIKVTDDVLTIYDKNYVATSTYGRFNTYDINKNLVSSELIQKMPFIRTFADNEKYYTFHILKEFISYGGSLQTEIGEVETDYIAHQEENRSLDLTNLPLYSKNDYINDSKVYNEWGKYEITGNEAHIGVSELGNGLYQFFIGPINNLLQSSTEIVAYSNYFKGVKFEDRRNYDDCIYGYANDNYIRITTSKYSTVDTFKAKLQELYNAGTPVYMIYKLATPTETEITDKKVIAQLEELYNTYAYDEVTNISVDNPILSAPLVLDVEYYIKTALGLETKVSYEEYAKLLKRVEQLEAQIGG